MIPEVMTDRWCSFARLNFQTHKCLLLPTWCFVCRLALVINIYCSLDVKLLSTTCSIQYVVGLHFDQVHFKELVSAMSIIFLLFLLQWNDSIHTKKLKKKTPKNPQNNAKYSKRYDVLIYGAYERPWFICKANHNIRCHYKINNNCKSVQWWSRRRVSPIKGKNVFEILSWWRNDFPVMFSRNDFIVLQKRIVSVSASTALLQSQIQQNAMKINLIT